MKSSKKLQISSHLLFVYINNQDRKWRMSVLVFSSALVLSSHLYSTLTTHTSDHGLAWINLNRDVASFVEPANRVNLRSKLILV